MMTDGLDRDDYEALLEMARAKGAAHRARLEAAAADLFSGHGGALSDRERVLMSGILGGLLHDAELAVRRRLSAELGDEPGDLRAALADEEVALARPILERSALLRDPGLVEVIAHRALQHRLCAALRRAGAVAEDGGADAVKALLEDADAGISRAAEEYLVEQAKRVDGYQNPLLRRADLDPGLAGSLYWRVAAALRIDLAERFEADPAALDEALDVAVSEITAAGAAPAWAAELARRLHAAGRITPETLVRVLRQGEIPLFEAMFAEISQLSPRLLARILFEPGGEALAVLCKGTDIPKNNFAALFSLTRMAASAGRPVPAAERDRALALYDRIGAAAARAVLGHWRRHPRYLDALRVLIPETPNGAAKTPRRARARTTRRRKTPPQA